MAKYIVANNGRKLTEEELKDIYSMFSTSTFNERDYKAWKYDKLEQGIIKFAE